MRWILYIVLVVATGLSWTAYRQRLPELDLSTTKGWLEIGEKQWPLDQVSLHLDVFNEQARFRLWAHERGEAEGTYAMVFSGELKAPYPRELIELVDRNLLLRPDTTDRSDMSVSGIANAMQAKSEVDLRVELVSGNQVLLSFSGLFEQTGDGASLAAQQVRGELIAVIVMRRIPLGI